MRRRHMPASDGEMLTLCGHAATKQEYRRMITLQIEEVTCKRCLNLNIANIEKIEEIDYKREEDLDKRIQMIIS
ncbi:hypothetical protein OAO35_00095 [Euryarchaeota archaeon]|nr:hypothetical protein [Euryarchaeota archaeon]